METKNMIKRMGNKCFMGSRCMALLCSLLLAAAFVGCSDDGYEYDDYHCNLTIDNSVHLDQTLASSMNPMTPGIFCTVSYKLKGGAKWFVFSNNAGQSSESIFNAIDERQNSERRIGKYNALIIGYSNSGMPARFYAYDGQCPNCFNPDAIPLKAHPLSVGFGGLATCHTCKRSYDLNAGGYISSGDNGNMLKPYRAENTGPNGMLHVY